MSFEAEYQYMFYLSNIFLKYNIDGACVPQFKTSYICNTTNILHENCLSCVVMCNICGGGNKNWNSKSGSISKITKPIRSILMFVPRKNPPGYKEHVIYSIGFALG